MKVLRFIFENILFIFTLFLLAFIPLYPKLPLVDIENTWVYIRAEDFIVVFVLLLWVILLIRQKITLRTPLTLPIIIFWIIGAISTIHGVLLIFPKLTGVFPHVAFLSFLRRIEYMSLFFIAYSGVKDKRFITYAVTVLAITLLFVVGYGVGQKFYGFPAYLTMNEEFAKGIPLRLSPLSRISSTFGGHYDLAAYLVLIIPLLTSMIFGFRNWFAKFFLSVTVCLGFALLFMTVSRVSFFVLLISVVAVLFFQRKRLIILSLLLITFLFLSFSPSLVQRFGNTIKEVDVLVNSKTGEVIGHVKEVPSEYLKDKIIKIKFAQSKSEIDVTDEKEDAKLTSSSALIVPYSQLSPFIPLIVESNRPTGENLPQGTGYINLPLSPVTKKLGQFFYQKTNEGRATESAILNVHGDFLIKRAKAFDLSFTTRFQGEWPRAIESFERNILLGSGYSSMGLAVDNNYLRILGEVGLLGFSSFFAIFLIVGIYIKKILPEVDSPIVKSFILGFVAGVIGLALNAILIDVFEASKIAFLLWLLVGMTLGVLHLYQKGEIDVYKELKKIVTSSYAVIICLFIVTVAVFSQILNYYFVGDDFTWLRWTADCNNCQSIITTIFHYFTDANGFFYRPGTKAYFLLMYSGFWLNQLMYHLVSIFLHFTVAMLLFLLSKRIFKNFLLSTATASLFIILSGYSEAIFWISATGHLFNAMFILLGLLFFIFFEEKRKNIYLILSFIAIVFSLLFHELGIITPFLIVLYRYSIQGKITFKELFKKFQYLIIFSPILPYLGLRYLAHSHWFNGDYSYNILKLPYNIVGNIIGYLFLTLFGPASLPVYQLLRNFSKEHFILSTLASLMVIYIFIVFYKTVIRKMAKEERNIVIFGFLFFVIALLPFLGLGNIASRYSYLSSIGFILLFVLFLKKLYAYLKSNGRYIAMGSVVLLVGIFCFLQLIQLQQTDKDWHEAGEKSQRFLVSIGGLHSDYWKKEHMKFYFINVPIRVREAWMFPVGLKDALWLVFRNNNIDVYQLSSVDQALNIIEDPIREKVFEFDDTGAVIERKKLP